MAEFSRFDGLLYPEAPRWRDGLLWVSDVHDFHLKAFDANGVLKALISVPERPSGLGFLPDGRLLMATGLGRRLHVVEGGATSITADLSGLTRGLLNDMVVDRHGRAYVGDTGFDLGAGEPWRAGQLFFVDGSTVRTVVDDLDFPNGMALTPDGRTLFLAETFANRITAFNVDEDGSLGERRTYAMLDGTPDGLCLDVEGALWIATLARGQFQRIDATGTVIDRIEVAPDQAIACMIGGSDRSTLFLCHTVVEQQSDGTVRRKGYITQRPAPAAGAGYP